MVATSHLALHHLCLPPQSRQLPSFPCLGPCQHRYRVSDGRRHLVRPLPGTRSSRRLLPSSPSRLFLGSGSGFVPSSLGRVAWGLIRPVSPSRLPRRTPSHPAATLPDHLGVSHAASQPFPALTPRLSQPQAASPASSPGTLSLPSLRTKCPTGPRLSLRAHVASGQSPSPQVPTPRPLQGSRTSLIPRSLFPLPGCPSLLALAPLPVV